MTLVLMPKSTVWDCNSVENLVIDLLGKLLAEDPTMLRARLSGDGLHMPVDSLDLFDVLQEFREITGISVPVRKLGHRTMRSITAFAAFVTEEQL